MVDPVIRNHERTLEDGNSVMEIKSLYLESIGHIAPPGGLLTWEMCLTEVIGAWSENREDCLTL